MNDDGVWLVGGSMPDVSVQVGVVQGEGRLERHVADYAAHAVESAQAAVQDRA